MTASNHAVTGALVATLVKQPAAAIPLALASHFVIDTIPHFKVSSDRTSKKIFWMVNFADTVATICFLIILPGYLSTVAAPWLTATCMAVAVAPDLPWIYRLYKEMKTRQVKRGNIFTRFHIWIQWKETEQGALIEAAWLITTIAAISYLR